MTQAIPDGLKRSLAMQLIAGQGWNWQGPNGDQVQVEKCPFCGDERSKFYVKVLDPASGSTGDGLWFCHRCTETGNLRKLQEHLGLRIAGVDSRSDWSGKSTGAPDSLPDAGACHTALLGNAEAMDYLLNVRGFTQEIISRQKLGLKEKVYFRKAGETKALVIPYLSVEGNVTFAKFRTLPPAEKDFTCPHGWEAGLYNAAILNEDCKEVIMVEGECLLGDTEVLTPTGWQRLDTLAPNTLVAQWDKGRATFVKPLSYICKPYTGEMVKFSSKTGLVDLVCTPEHRVLYQNYVSKKTETRSAQKVPKGSACFYRVANLKGKGITLTNAELRLSVAIQADATLENKHVNTEHFNSDGKDGWSLEFRKLRKIKRMRTLLKASGTEYTEYKLGRGTKLFRFRAEKYKYSKVFPENYYEMNEQQRTVFIAEIALWDSHVQPDGTVMYSSIIEKNVDLVQTIFAVSGLSAKKGVEIIKNKANKFWVCVPKRDKRGSHVTTSGASIKKTTILFSGNVYCVQVPSSYILIRRGGTILITGNCDALSLMSQGIENVVGVPGANVHKAAWVETLDKLSPKIYILYDSDKAGTKGAQELASRIGLDKCLKILLPSGVKDINEFFTKGGTLEQFEEMKHRAIQFDVTGVASASSALDEIEEELNGKSDLSPTYVTQWPKFNELIGFENGDVIDIVAGAKVGKTTLGLNLIDHMVST